MHAVLLVALLFQVDSKPVAADVVIHRAMIYDGSGKPGLSGAIAIQGDRIVAVGRFAVQGQPRVIDGKGLIVAPGFIDLHTHSDNPIVRPATRANLNYLMQGVTTIVTGNCGSGPVDVAAFYKKIDEHGAGSNVAHQIPHNSLRQQVMGNVARPPTKDELERMKGLVERGMRDGAWGLSTGLIYTPGSYADTDELVELAQVAAEHRGFYASHIRGEGIELLTSVNEILEIGRRAKLPVHISHMKASGRKVWGKSADAIALVEQARANGQIVTADQYPYTASSTSLAATLIPTKYREGTHAEMVARFNDPELGPKVRAAIKDNLGGRDGGRALRIASHAKRPEWSGKDLATIAEQERKPVLDLVLEIERSGGAGIVNFGMSEEDVRLIMRQPFVATASDGSARVPSADVPHPRSYGCFPRKIGRYAIEEKLIPLEQAIRSSSGLPADILRLPERGYLKPGYYADVVVFDPQTFRDTATFEQPHQYAPGVRYLFVNGVLTIDDGKYTGALPGKALRYGGSAELKLTK
jgi:N-acyl-D-aspartate/D-glutamate deacylase